jgi:hypothetical protein
MNYMDFDQHLIGERNQQMHKDVNSLRLEERLRNGHNPRSSRVATWIKRGRLLIGGPKQPRRRSIHPTS